MCTRNRLKCPWPSPSSRLGTPRAFLESLGRPCLEAEAGVVPMCWLRNRLCSKNRNKTGYLNLKYPTWLPLSCRKMKTIMSLTRDNKKILVHALVRFEETRNERDFEDPSFKVISHTFKVLAIIHPVDIVMGNIYSHLFIKGVHTT